MAIGSQDTPRHPNILFIAVDDLRPELGAYGTKVITPNIDGLAATGMRFDRAYCQQAVCGASRLSLMGGLYPTATKEQTFHVQDWRKRHPGLLTMNQYFGHKGYHTIGLGKIYHGTSGPGVDPENWGEWINLQAPEYALAENVAIAEKARQGSKRDPYKGPTTEMADVSDHTYADGQRAVRASEVLRSLGEGDGKPFFLAVGFTKPHLPFIAPKKYWDLYERGDFKMPSNRSIPPGYPKHAANLPAYEMQKYSDFEGKSPTDFSEELNLRLLHGYAAATSYMDACVGVVLQTLEDTGLANNTVVVFWGDHGWKLGDHSTWTKHTNFECDTRVPLIIRDPRLDGGLSTPRLVELIDLYPTLCDLAGLPVPKHCQGRSFGHLLSEPSAGHRYNAYSSYPAAKWMGHSLRFGKYRYTEWHDKESGVVTAKVLTDLVSDPGETTNIVEETAFSDVVSDASARLNERINHALEGAKLSPAVVSLDLTKENQRQTIDGFGGSLAFWGTDADDKALKIAMKELSPSIIRAQGEVSPGGIVDHNREILQRVMALNPELEIALTFWQPRSVEHLEPDYWLETIEANGSSQYSLKKELEDEWADELVARVQQYLDWGVNVTVLGIQNESNWSRIGAQTCRWEPARLAQFITTKIKPRLEAKGLGAIEISAPELAYIGHKASEITRYLPTITNPSVSICSYHIYDSYPHGQKGDVSNLSDNAKSLGELRAEHFPGKRLWMTETSGAQWNSDRWHTYGWKPGLTEHEKAILAGRYIHTTLVDAGANAFLWWGLVYSEAPATETDERRHQKHRDEGLVLVKETRESGRQAFLERTKKFHVFRQYSAFVKRGYQRIHVSSPQNIQLSCFMSPDRRELVAVAINDTNVPLELKLLTPSGMALVTARQTDVMQNFREVESDTKLPSKSVRTLIYQEMIK